MELLRQEKCVPCANKVHPATEAEIRELKSHLPDWSIIEQNGRLRLEKSYQFRDFKTALAFTQQVAEEAEREGHHPAILTEWGKTTVRWWTHAFDGLHRNDFVMAARTDYVADRFFTPELLGCA